MKRNPNFDLLRGALALWVIIVHACWLSGIQGGWLGWSGRVAVDIFIVLSGYLVSKSLITKRPTYWRFISGRFARLFPAFAVALAFALLLRPLTIGQVPGELPRETAENSFFLFQLVSHLSLLFGLVPHAILPQSSVAFLPPAWTATLEMQFYLLAPLLVWAATRLGERAVSWSLAFSSIALVPQLAWRLHDFYSPVGAFFGQKATFFILGLCLALGNRVFWKSKYQRTELIALPGARTLAQLGVWSYSLYLVHYPILHLIRASLPSAAPPLACVLLQLGIGGPVTIALAHLLYRFVERPCSFRNNAG